MTQTPLYKIYIRDHTGNIVAILDRFLRLQYSHRDNGPGSCVIVLPGDDVRRKLLKVDYIIEVWRSLTTGGVGWYKEWEGFYRSKTQGTYESGIKQFTLYAVGFEDFLRRRSIAYKAGTAYTTKIGVGEAVIKEFVRENAGSSASSSDRARNGMFPGLTVEADHGYGDVWYGSRAWKPLLETCQGIAAVTGVDFAITGLTDNDSTAPEFEFKVYNGQRGKDRTNDNLDAGGKNPAGNTPVIFSIETGTVARAVFAVARTGEINTVIVTGRGTGEDRDVVVVSDVTRQTESPWNSCEVIRDARNENEEEDALIAFGQRALDEYSAIESLSFTPLQTAAQIYGKHYFFGDIVTSRYEGNERNFKLTAVDISIDEGSKESIGLEFSEVSTLGVV